MNEARPSLSGHDRSILDIAKFDLNNKIEPPHVLQWGPQNQIRAINDQMLESIFAGMMNTENAMAKTNIRVEHVRHGFSHNTSH